MGISHVTVNLGLRHQCRHRVDHQNVDGTGAHHGLRNLQGLFAGIRLGNVEIVNVYTDILRILGIQRMLGIDKARNTAPLLYLGHRMKRQCGLTGGLRSVDLNDTALREAAGAQRDIQ